MTLTVNLSPEEEARLREKATRRGQNEAAYAASVLRHDLHQSAPTIIRSKLTTEEFLQSSRDGFERAKARNMPPVQSDFRREDIYDDEEGC